MIPKIIHYCWFGGNELPKSAQKCINSWKKFFPGYEIKRWDETNFNVNSNLYIKQAYNEKKYAFVSDYARFYILYNYGGVYFDTDVEVISSFDDLIDDSKSFMGCEIDGSNNSLIDQYTIKVAPGLVLASVQHNEIYKKILDKYDSLKFINNDGSYIQTTVVSYVTDILIKNGLKDVKDIQKVGDIVIYPKEYFNPLNDLTGKLTITENTRSIHWYSKTWLDKKSIIISKISRVFHYLFGEKCFSWIHKFFK